MSLETRKMPLPSTLPTVSSAASHGPRARTSSPDDFPALGKAAILAGREVAAARAGVRRSRAMSEPKTHRRIDAVRVGAPVALGEGRATARLTAIAEMAADERGLVHGGFVFGLADYAAMLAVDEPNVVLAAADCRFLAPVVVGDELEAEARRESIDGKRHRIRVVVTRGATTVFEGDFVAAVPARHVLDREPRL
jgi:acyl-coenzyme A thioesterase PaaI-like protein